MQLKTQLEFPGASYRCISHFSSRDLCTHKVAYSTHKHHLFLRIDWKMLSAFHVLLFHNVMNNWLCLCFLSSYAIHLPLFFSRHDNKAGDLTKDETHFVVNWEQVNQTSDEPIFADKWLFELFWWLLVSGLGAVWLLRCWGIFTENFLIRVLENKFWQRNKKILFKVARSLKLLNFPAIC